jgi:hypothetical protein
MSINTVVGKTSNLIKWFITRCVLDSSTTNQHFSYVRKTAVGLRCSYQHVSLYNYVFDIDWVWLDMGKRRNSYILIRKRKGGSGFGRPRPKWESNIIKYAS